MLLLSTSASFIVLYKSRTNKEHRIKDEQYVVVLHLALSARSLPVDIYIMHDSRNITCLVIKMMLCNAGQE